MSIGGRMALFSSGEFECFEAPLASMEDLSVIQTPMSTPTAGQSPKSIRARWSHRSSSGATLEKMLGPINEVDDDDDDVEDDCAEGFQDEGDLEDRLNLSVGSSSGVDDEDQKRPLLTSAGANLSEGFLRPNQTLSPVGTARPYPKERRPQVPSGPPLHLRTQPLLLPHTKELLEVRNLPGSRQPLYFSSSSVSNFGHVPSRPDAAPNLMSFKSNEVPKANASRFVTTNGKNGLPIVSTLDNNNLRRFGNPFEVIHEEEAISHVPAGHYPVSHHDLNLGSCESPPCQRHHFPGERPIQAAPECVAFVAARNIRSHHQMCRHHQPHHCHCCTASRSCSKAKGRKGHQEQPTKVAMSNSSRVRPEMSSLIRANEGRICNAKSFKAPKDRMNLIYLTLVLHGIGTLMPWNMIITAKEYFVNYKLGKEYTNAEAPYSTYYLQYIGFAAQVPNVLFNWINVFLHIKYEGNLTSRIVWTLLLEIVVFVVTIVLAMVDTSHHPGVFFYVTAASIVVLNMANGIYQNTVYGLAAKLPFKYTGAVVLGSNLSGTIVALINIASIALAPNSRTAAIYYFITALFILLACFDTYFALPLNRFFRYHEHVHAKILQEKKKFRLQGRVVHALPYWSIFRQCFPQCFNVFFVFFVSLSVFPAVYSDVKMAHDDFVIQEPYFIPVTCFLTFNLCAVLGNLVPSQRCSLPGPRWLFIPVLLRFLFIPFFALCNYKPSGVERLWPVLFHWDWAYWAGGALLGLTSGYLSSLAMMYCPRSVDPEYSSIAGMFGAASIVTGIFAGIGFSYLMPILVSHPSLIFYSPDWWPQYVN